MKKFAQALLGAATAMAISASAQAAPVSNLFNFGANGAQDVSGEFVLRANGQGGFDAVTGQVQVGDLFVGAFAIDSLNSTSIGAGSSYNELTGIFVTQVSGITPINGAVGSYTFQAASSATLSALLPGVGGAPAGSVLFAFEDPSNNFNRTSGIPTGLATASDGDLRLILGFENGNEFFGADSAPLDLSLFGTPGSTSTPLGNYEFGLNVLWGGFVGFDFGKIANDDIFTDYNETLYDFVGTGRLYRPEPNTSFPVQDDLAVAFNVTAVPEPAALGLLGMGLAAVGFGRRRRKA